MPVNRTEPLSVSYEAGPPGYQLHRLISSMGVSCQVITPSLVPKGASDRVKTDRRDAVRLALALCAGTLAQVRVPPPAEEAAQGMVRARGALEARAPWPASGGRSSAATPPGRR